MTTKSVWESLNVNPTGQGIFGFSHFAEVWNGRMAMLGFAAAVVNELLTGKGILEQIGITTTGGSLLVALFLTGFSVAASIGYYAVKFEKVRGTEAAPEP